MAKPNDFGKLILREYEKFKNMDSKEKTEYRKKTRKNEISTAINIYELYNKGFINEREKDDLIENLRNRVLVESYNIRDENIPDQDLRMCARHFVYTLCADFTNKNSKTSEYIKIIKDRIAYKEKYSKEEREGLLLSFRSYVKNLREDEQL